MMDYEFSGQILRFDWPKNAASLRFSTCFRKGGSVESHICQRQADMGHSEMAVSAEDRKMTGPSLNGMKH